MESWREPTSPSSTSIPSTPALPVTCEYISVSPTTTDNAAVFAGQLWKVPRVQQPIMSEAITQSRSSCTGTHCLTVKTLSSSCCIDSRSCTNTIYMYSRMLVSSLNYRPRLSKQPTQSMWKSFESKICTKRGVTSAGSDPDSPGLRSHMHIILY